MQWAFLQKLYNFIGLFSASGRVWCGCWWPMLCVTLYRPSALLSPNMGPGAMWYVWHQPIRTQYGDKSANQRPESAAHYHATLFIGPAAPPGINWYFLAPLNGVKTNKPTLINSSCPWHISEFPPTYRDWVSSQGVAEREAQLRPAGGYVTWLLTGIFTFEKEEEFSRNLSHSLLSSRAAALFELPISTRELFTLISRCKDSQKYWISFWLDLVRIYSCGSFPPSPLFAVNV